MLIIVYNRCFPHVVNLAVQAVLSSITDMRHAEEGNDLQWFITPDDCYDVIAILRSLINKV